MQLAGEEVKPTVVVGLPVAYSSNQLLNAQDIDTEKDNPQLVACYVKDIYKYLLDVEVSSHSVSALNSLIMLQFHQARTPIKSAYMDGYKIKPTMRTILIDWLVEVHGRFKLLQETLYLTISIMDRFLQVSSQRRKCE